MVKQLERVWDFDNSEGDPKYRLIFTCAFKKMKAILTCMTSKLSIIGNLNFMLHLKQFSASALDYHSDKKSKDATQFKGNQYIFSLIGMQHVNHHIKVHFTLQTARPQVH